MLKHWKNLSTLHLSRENLCKKQYCNVTKTNRFVLKILEKLNLITYAESLGGVETLITYPMLQTHGDVPVDVREKLGITENFLRLSVGIENAEDLISDLSQAIG